MEIEVNKDNFEEVVVSSKGLFLLDYWGPSCQPCLALMPFVDELAGKHKEALKVGKVDSSQNRRLCISQKVMSLPSFLMYKDGQEVGRLTGNAATKEELGKFVASYLQEN